MLDPRMQIIVRSFKELGEYIGKKFDGLTSQINGLAPADSTPILNAIADLAAAIKARDPIISVAAPDLEPLLLAIVSLHELLDQQEPKEQKDFEPTLKAIKAAIDNKDFSPLIEVKAPAVDLAPLLIAMNALKPATTDFTPVLDAIADLKTAFKKKQEISVKFDDMQMRALTANRGGAGSPPTATRSTIKNLSMPLADTEYSYPLPPNTLSWTIRVRDTDVPLLYAFAAGKLPVSGDGSAYATVPAYYLQSQPGVEWSARTIYLQTASAGQVAEIISHQI